MNNSTSSEQAKIDAEIAVAATRASVKNAAQSVTRSQRISQRKNGRI